MKPKFSRSFGNPPCYLGKIACGHNEYSLRFVDGEEHPKLQFDTEADLLSAIEAVAEKRVPFAGGSFNMGRVTTQEC